MTDAAGTQKNHLTPIDLDGAYVLQTYRRPKFVLERGEGSWLFDDQGRRYLDAVSGIAVNVLGYGDREVVDTLKSAADGLIHVSNLYYTAPQAELARSLVSLSFADRVFFCNSGTEAVEAALKFARKFGRSFHGEDKTDIVAFSHSFHGRTMGALSVTATEKYRQPFEPLIPGVTFSPFNEIGPAVDAIGENTCAVIVEPVQGEGGVYPATPEFLQALRQACNKNGALLIFDEVQCGLGRSGTLWAYEQFGVSPDLMTLAKPMAGGLPMGAVLMNQAVADVMVPGDHGSTFAAGPLVCQVAQVILDRVSQPAFLEDVRAKSAQMKEGLQRLKAGRKGIREVRGLGLMWGVELTQEAAPVIAAGYEQGLIACAAGPNVVRLLPHLTVSSEEIEEIVDRLEAALNQVEGDKQ